MKALTLALILGVVILLLFNGKHEYAYASNTIRGIGTLPVYEPISYLGTEESIGDYLFRICNENPSKYDFWKNKIIFDTKLCVDNGACNLKEWNLFGTSMRPTIISGDSVIIKSDISYNLTKGMVVVYDMRTDLKGSPLDFENAKKYEFNIIHRVVEVEKDNIIVKGDNNNENNPCEYIPRSAIRGVVVELIK